MRRPIHPSDLQLSRRRADVGRVGPHAFDTEVRTLDQALNIIQQRQTRKEIAEKQKTNRKPPSLKAQFAMAQVHTRMRLGQINMNRPVALKLPHPFRDMAEDQKPLKVREMFASGHWGVGIPAQRRLAKLFAVPLGQITFWLAE